MEKHSLLSKQLWIQYHERIAVYGKPYNQASAFIVGFYFILLPIYKVGISALYGLVSQGFCTCSYSLCWFYTTLFNIHELVTTLIFIWIGYLNSSHLGHYNEITFSLSTSHRRIHVGRPGFLLRFFACDNNCWATLLSIVQQS